MIAQQEQELVTSIVNKITKSINNAMKAGLMNCLSNSKDSETILVIHGTYANFKRNSEEKKQSPKWWKPSSEFCQNLDEALKEKGCEARCWNKTEEFNWSSENSEMARRVGGKKLAERLDELENNRNIRRYHLVAHSHGGNLVRHALRFMKERRNKLGKVIYLGTPFLHFKEKNKFLRYLSLIHWPLFFGMVGITFAFLFELSWINNLGIFWRYTIYCLYVGAILGALIRLIIYSDYPFFIPYPRENQSFQREQSHLLRFTEDEAIAFLKRWKEIAEKPFDFFEKVLGQPFWPKFKLFLSSRIPFLNKAFFYFVGEYDRREPKLLSQLNAHILSIISVIGQAIYSKLPTKPKLFLSSRIPFLRKPKLLSESSAVNYDIPSILFVIGDAISSILPVILYLLIFVFDCLLGGINWLVNVIKRGVMLLGLKLAANTPFGIDTLFSRFVVEDTTNLPGDVEEHCLDCMCKALFVEDTINLTDDVEEHPISEDAEKNLSLNNTIVIDELRSILSKTGVNTLVAEVTKVFSHNVKLLHSQYYINKKVIGQIADLIVK